MRSNILYFFSAIVLGVVLSGCSSRPDYSGLQVIGSQKFEKVGDACSALGVGYNFYRYTCTGWTAPAERCLQSDEEAQTIVNQMSESTGRACRLIEVIRHNQGAAH